MKSNEFLQTFWEYYKIMKYEYILKPKFLSRVDDLFSVLCRFAEHSSMPIPLAPDPIRVQPCVWCLF